MSHAHNPFGDGKASLRIRDILRAQATSAKSYERERFRHAS
jgi:UDP-N-acetylglucosamine 2-epimerase